MRAPERADLLQRNGVARPSIAAPFPAGGLPAQQQHAHHPLLSLQPPLVMQTTSRM